LKPFQILKSNFEMTITNKLSWENTPKNHVVLLNAIKRYRPFEAKHGEKESKWDQIVYEVSRSANNSITKQTAKDVFNRLYNTYLKENPLNGERYSGVVTMENTVSLEMQVLVEDVLRAQIRKDKRKKENDDLKKRKEESYQIGSSMLQTSLKRIKTSQKGSKPIQSISTNPPTTPSNSIYPSPSSAEVISTPNVEHYSNIDTDNENSTPFFEPQKRPQKRGNIHY
jgi:hypothetical protein